MVQTAQSGRTFRDSGQADNRQDQRSDKEWMADISPIARDHTVQQAIHPHGQVLRTPQ